MPPAPGNADPGGVRWDVRWVAETGSTNADALDLARLGAPEGLVLVADHQTAGRGRLGRTWTAPPGSSLLCTVLLRPPAAVAELATTAAALAMAAAVTATTGVEPRLKWPNDLVVDDRKLAGVLAEADWADPAGPAVCVGVGVNCNWPEEVPAELAGRLVALNHLTGREVDRRALLDAYLAALADRYPIDPAALLDEWRARSATLGRRVRVELPDGTTVEGTAAGVTDGGHLVVDADGGGRRTFAAGDVVHLR